MLGPTTVKSKSNLNLSFLGLNPGLRSAAERVENVVAVTVSTKAQCLIPEIW